MTCAERRDLFLMLTSGALDPAEEKELRAHLATGCVECAGYMAEAQAVWSQIPLGIAPVKPSPAAKELLNIKIQGTAPQSADRSGNGPIPISQPSPALPAKKPFNSHVISAIAAAIAILITWGVMNGIVSRKEATIQQLNDQIAQQNEQLRGLSEQVRNASDVIHMLRRPDVKIVSLDAADKSQAYGRMLWDGKANSGLLVGSKIKRADAGRCYELWVIVGDNKLAAGRVEVNAAGDATLPVIWKDPVHTATFAITNEPERDNITQPAPDATVMLAGKMD